MQIKPRVIAALAAFFLFMISSAGFAEKVKAINKNGEIELEGGARIKLAGLKLVPEGLPILASLLAQKELEFDPENSLIKSQASPSFTFPSATPAYIFVKTKEIILPFELAVSPKEERIMVNELLLMTGAATVDLAIDFKWKDKFKAAEALAKQKGEGIWSYEKSV